jgi:hypothetical protein
MKAKEIIVLIGLALGSSLAQASAPTLQVIANEDTGFPGLVWDSGQSLTWLKDTNWAWSSGYNSGFMTWHEAMTWADQLVVTYNGHVYDDWRLPTVSEMNYLRVNYTSDGYPIGTGYTQPPGQVTHPGPFLVGRFIAIATADAWARDEVSDDIAKYMDMDAVYSATGYEADKATPMLTWGAVMVPEPDTYVMLLAGLGLVGFLARQTQRGRVIPIAHADQSDGRTS